MRILPPRRLSHSVLPRPSVASRSSTLGPRSSLLTPPPAVDQDVTHRITMGSKTSDSRRARCRARSTCSILKTLSIGVMHGYGVAQHIQTVSGDVLRVEEGSLYPALAAAPDSGARRVGVGPLGQQSPRPLLPADARGPPRAGRRRIQLRSPHFRHYPGHEARVERPIDRLGERMMVLYRRLRAWLRRSRLEAELREELAQHTAWKAESLLADGVDEPEARRRAAVAVGNATRHRERARGVWGFQSIDSLLQDVRYGVRVLTKSPAFTGFAVASLAIGIGAGAAVFSLADTVLLRTMGVRDPASLVLMRWTSGPVSPFCSLNGNGDQNDSGLSSTSFSYVAYQSFRDGRIPIPRRHRLCRSVSGQRVGRRPRRVGNRARRVRQLLRRAGRRTRARARAWRNRRRAPPPRPRR